MKVNTTFQEGKVRDVCAIIVLFFISLIAWKMKSFVENNIPQTLLGIFFSCFITNSTVLLPATSLIIVLEYAQIINPYAVVIIGALGATTGELTGYYVGRAGSNIIKSERIKRFKNKFDKHAYLWIFIFALIPLPIFDVTGILAGGVKTNVVGFYAACVTGKLVKMGSYVLAFRVLENISKAFM